MNRVSLRGVEGSRASARRRVWTYGAVALVAIALFAAVGMRPVQSGRSEVRQVQADDRALRRVLDLRATLGDLQVFIEPHLALLSTTASSIDPGDIARGSQLGDTQPSQGLSAVKTLRAMGLADTARDVEAASAAFGKALTNLAPLIAGRPLLEVAAGIAKERSAFLQARAITAAAATQLTRASDRDANEALGHLDNGRTTFLTMDAIAAGMVVCGAVLLGHRARRREVADRGVAQRQEFETMLQQALEMSKTEADAYGVMTEALLECVPHLQVEMLVADSSRAHFYETLDTNAVTGAEPRTGCGVVSPLDCPAARRGHTMVFQSSRALDACPHLKARPSGDLTAACVAVNVTGKTSGVVHATGPDGVAATERDVGYLEITARRASERIAMLRAFEKFEAQARTDSLTGLWNRRSLENRVRELYREGIPYALAYGDLDQFKALNDNHGHEAGDQALRLFSRVLRDSIRPRDMTARWGGEEFVIVLPDCDVDTAVKVLERLRERLALTLTSGRVTAFTVSFGVASSVDADTFDDVIADADRALLVAKSDGRNRTVVAQDATVHSPGGLVS